MTLKLYSFLLFILQFCLLSEAKVSDINYIPLNGEFAGRTQVNFLRDTTRLEISGSEFLLETDQRTIDQSFFYGLTPWVSAGITVPFLFNGSSSVESGTSQTTNALASDLRRSIFTISAQFGPELQAQSFLTASFQESEADRPGFYEFSYAVRKKLEVSSYFLEFKFKELNEDFLVQKQRFYNLNFLMQLELASGFFLRPGFLLAHETGLIFKDTDETLEGDFVVTPSFSLGQELEDYHFFWLVSYKFSYAKMTYFDGLNDEQGENLAQNLEFQFGYKF